jgi:hypothetical protein
MHSSIRGTGARKLPRINAATGAPHRSHRSHAMRRRVRSVRAQGSLRARVRRARRTRAPSRQQDRGQCLRPAPRRRLRGHRCRHRCGQRGRSRRRRASRSRRRAGRPARPSRRATSATALRTADGARWAVEGREHAVACLFHHPAAEASQLGRGTRVDPGQQMSGSRRNLSRAAAHPRSTTSGTSPPIELRGGRITK